MNLGPLSHFYLVDKVIIDSRLLGTHNWPWQIPEFYQMLGAVLGKLMSGVSLHHCREAKDSCFISSKCDSLGIPAVYSAFLTLMGTETNPLICIVVACH